MKFITISAFLIFTIHSVLGQSIDCYTSFLEKRLVTAYSKKILICHPTINDSSIDTWQFFVNETLKERKATAIIKLTGALPFFTDSSAVSKILQYTTPMPRRMVWCLIQQFFY
jgi:hypothetical protein